MNKKAQADAPYGKHTPGPWHLEEGRTGENTQQQGYVCRPGRHSIETNIDDARLIAAAPELLEALKEALDLHRILIAMAALKVVPPHLTQEQLDAARTQLHESIQVARAAIAKAEGSS